MNEVELLRIYEAQPTAQMRDERIPLEGRDDAAGVLNACRRLPGAGLRPRDEPRTWVFSDPHFEHEESVAIFNRPFRGCHDGDSHLIGNWTREVRDHDTVLCLGDVTIDRPTDGLIDRIRGWPAARSSWRATTTARTSASSGERSTRSRRVPTFRANRTCSSPRFPSRTCRPAA